MTGEPEHPYEEARRITEEWFEKTLLEGRSLHSIPSEGRYNCRNMLAGFLQAAEMFGHISHDEAQKIFEELAE